jgi:hypothetical protein
MRYDRDRFTPSNVPSKKLLVTDAYGNPVEIKSSTPDRIFAVIDQRHRLNGASGKVVSRHSDMPAATRSLNKTPHGRICELRTDMAIGELVYGHNIIPDNFARWS